MYTQLYKYLYITSFPRPGHSALGSLGPRQGVGPPRISTIIYMIRNKQIHTTTTTNNTTTTTTTNNNNKTHNNK